jgi:transcriptional regulator with XRE-family HTH domain
MQKRLYIILHVMQKDGMKLSDYLSLSHLTDSAFAKAVGVHHTTVGRWKRAETRPDWEQIDRIVDATAGAVTPNDFIILPRAKPQPTRTA